MGRYRIVDQIGKGSFGEVYEVEHEGLGKRFALKVMNDGTRESTEVQVKRFRREAQALSRISSPHVVKVTDAGSTPGGLFFYVMEKLEGEELGDILRRDGRFSWQRARDIGVQILAALAAAHEVGVIHRDLKPSNCFLVKDHTGAELVKVLDFGIAKLFGEDDANQTNLTGLGVIMGSPAYMAPEQALDRPLDQRTDVYGAGVLMYQLLTGRLPFPGRSAIECLTAHVKDPPPPFDEVAADANIPEALQQVIMTALAKTKALRFQSAADFRAALDACR
jgi:serine/threonine-protein kinase